MQDSGLLDDADDATTAEDLLVQYEAERILRAERARQLAEERKPGNALRILTRAEVAALPRPEPLVRGLLYRSTVATFAATGGVGKTTAALDIALCMGTGQRFLGRQVQQGRVLFIEAEGLGAFDDRMRAWEVSRGLPEGSAGANIDFVPGVLLNLATLRELEAIVAGGDYALVVIDTFAASFRVKSENDNAEISEVYRSLKRIRDARPGVCVLILAHTTETVDARGRRNSKHRGASAFRDDSDTLILGKGSHDAFTITTCAVDGGKQRDGAEVSIQDLRLIPVGPHVVIGTMSEAEKTARIDMVRQRAMRLEPGRDYPSTEMREAVGLSTSKSAYEEWRVAAINQGWIEKTGDSKRAPYRRTAPAAEVVEAA